jgi:signal transduction histidine kinase
MRTRSANMVRAVRDLWAGRTRRDTALAFAGAALAIAGWSLTGALAVLVSAAVYSMATGPGDAGNYALYSAGALLCLVPLVWWLPAFSAAQRARLRWALGTEIAVPARPPGRWPRRMARACRMPTTWRQIGYHVLALAIGPGGSAAVAACWLALPAVVATAFLPGAGHPGWLLAVLAVPAVALLLAAPWVARGVAIADERLAVALLGPGQAERLAQRVEELARSRADIVAAADAERRRIERDLHDGAQQRLVSLALNLGMARAALTDTTGPSARAIVRAHDEVVAALAEMRDFVRGLHPAVLNDRGLGAALTGLVARAPLPVGLRTGLSSQCGRSVEAVAYFTVSEALTNIAKHSGATRADVTVECRGGRLRVTITDNGRGGAQVGGNGTGLRGLAQRAASVDGVLRVDSPDGGPTTISVELPCES